MQHVHVFALVAIAVLVAALCRRRGWPAPLVIVAVGLVASFVPGVPRFEIDAEVILEFVLPPLLYSAALSSSYRDFRASWNAITRLGVGLVLVTALAVALVAVAVHPTISFAAALVLGAVVAPPDAVAAAAVGRRLGLPRRVMTLLSGESLINDATSLTLFKVALAGAATGTWLLGDGLGTFALAVGVGVAVGAALGWLVHAIRMRLDDPVVASAIGLLTPFAAYWGAEALLGSGVLAVVAAGLYLGHTAPRAGYATRLYEEPIWSTVDLVLEAFTFALVGVQLPWVVRDVIASDQGLRPALVLSVSVLATTILVRPVYVFATARFDNLRLHGSHRPVQDALTARESAVVSWAGMRGVVTLAAAAAIPATAGGVAFPDRASLQLAACTVALGTLLLQGLTLPAVIRRLGVGSAAQAEAAEDATQEAQARLAMADAVQQMLERERTAWRAELGAEQADAAIDRLTRLTRERAAAAAVVIDPDNAEDMLDDGLTAWAPDHQHRADLAARTARVRRAVIGAQRAALVRRRDAGQIDEAVLRRMLHELDLEDEALSASWITRAGS